MINDFIDLEWSKDEDKGKASNILKGLLFSDDSMAKKFVSDLDELSSKMNKDDYK